MNQSVFRFEQYHDYSPENFLISPCNREAYEAVEQFPWSNYALCIYGPQGSGKTYLASIAVNKPHVTVIEDIDDSEIEERDLLHWLNSIKEDGEFVLITSTRPLKDIGFKLPDLVSRLGAINSIQIDKPDAELFYQLFARYFAARQLKVTDDVISYLSSRVERSFTAATKIVDEIDKMSLEQKRNITIPLVKKIVEK